MKRTLVHHAVALALLAPAAATLVAAPAHAQQRRVAAPEVNALQLNADNGLTPGSQMQFTVEGSPRGRASVSLGRTNIVVPLRETSLGVYRGTYTVKRVDRIDPTALMQARITSGNLTTVHNYTYPPSFQALAMGNAASQPAPTAAAAPFIERFAVNPVGRLESGADIRFRLNGLPGGKATVDIPGVVTNIAMTETRPGHYEAVYTVRNRDNLDAFTSATATLRANNQWVTSRLERPFQRGDNAAPTVSNLSPKQGEVINGPLVVSGSFDDGSGRGVDPRSVKLEIGGRDVTRDTDVSENRFTYRGNMPPGRYTAEVSARDRAGNVLNKSWTFDVGTSMGAAPASVNLTLFTPNNSQIDANGNVTLSGRTAPYAQVKLEVNAVAPVIGGRVGVAQSVYNNTVQADANGRFNVTVQPRALPIPGTRYEVQATATGQGGQTAESRVTLYPRG